jgi:hypothetical protein
MPFVLSAGVLGLDDVIRWVARRRTGWNASQARRVFGAAAVWFAVMITGYLLARSVVGIPNSGQIAWNQSNLLYREAGIVLDEMGISEDEMVMVNNPPGFYTMTGRGGIPLPSGYESMLLRAADHYGIHYLVVDSNVAPALEDLYLTGPESERLVLLDTLGPASGPIYMYEIRPD